METIKAIIVDDERAAREILDILLSQNNIPVEVLASCQDLRSAIPKIKSLKPDVVFLDVQMPEYAGYEIVNHFDTIEFEIVFITAYDHFAIKAFEINAIDYIVKPIERKRLDDALLRIKDKLSIKKDIVDYNRLLHNIKKEELTKIVIAESGKRHTLEIDSIIAIRASGSYCIVKTDNLEEIIVSKNLKHFENLLSESNCFYRSHRTWLINTKHVSYYKKTKLEIIMSHDVVAKISRKKLDEFAKYL